MAHPPLWIYHLLWQRSHKRACHRSWIDLRDSGKPLSSWTERTGRSHCPMHFLTGLSTPNNWNIPSEHAYMRKTLLFQLVSICHTQNYYRAPLL
ncbi:hypothetical protein D9758_017811 [Tetrapyrgos nigripes]|uniref:Uncharacterized protein n=1 Tax=Tetrapyrgos nigripes TaxID=182062 RepID=A0A8H5BH00_9AGAR|nr:hypothetical protein D9758_017811 [Tetrapyrgos nigripes]